MDTKPKKRANASWLNLQFGPIKLDFVAPFPLETTVQLLKRADAPHFRDHEIKIILSPEDADTFTFSLKGKATWKTLAPLIVADSSSDGSIARNAAVMRRNAIGE